MTARGPADAGEREAQIQRLANAWHMAKFSASPSGYGCTVRRGSESWMEAERAYNLGVRIPAPPVAAEPVVVVSEEARKAMAAAVFATGMYDQGLAAAFPHLLAANPKLVAAEAQRIAPRILEHLVEAEIRRRVEALGGESGIVEIHSNMDHMRVTMGRAGNTYAGIGVETLLALLTRPRDAAGGGP